MRFTAEDIANITHSELFGNQHLICEGINIDTRKKPLGPNEMFVALSGEKSNGHAYIQNAIENGIHLFLVEQLPNTYPTEVCFIKTKNTLLALQKLAQYHRQQFNIPVIGITGSNGKTIIKEWLYQLLSATMHVCASPNSYNSQIGVALSALLLEATHEIAIFEAGISKNFEMEKLHDIIKPSLGILSNIGTAHDEGFSSIEGKLNEKLKLFDTNCPLIYCMDHDLVHEKIKTTPISTIAWTNAGDKKDKASYYFKIEKKDNHTFIKIPDHNISIPFSDQASIENLCHCLAILLHLNLPLVQLLPNFNTLKPLNNRLEIKKGINGNTIINDSYSNDLVSLDLALQFQTQNNLLKQNKVLILSDLLQSHSDKTSLYKKVAECIERNEIHQLIGIGKGINEFAEYFKLENKIFFNDTETFLKSFQLEFWFNHSILLKGARLFAFERIDHALQQKAHQTVLEINLNAFVHNLNYYRKKIHSDTKIMVMVKAFAYGSGNVEIASLLQQQRVDYLAVAFVDEGVELRQAGITLPIMVMNTSTDAFDQMIDYQLEPELFSFKILEQWVNFIASRIQDKIPAVHIKLDTGMHRLGFETKETDALIAILKEKNIQVATIFSHLVASDNASFDAFTQQQTHAFHQMATQIKSILNQNSILHLANSNGITRHPATHFDMVRLGIGLYGVGHHEAEQKQLQLAGQLSTIISQIKQVPAGESVGYNRQGQSEKDRRIATLPIGYADGFSRLLSNAKGHVYIHGKLAKVVGNVCMDMCMIDVTDISCVEGDKVIIYESITQLQDLAAASQTIVYEILTNISTRVKRVYVNL